MNLQSQLFIGALVFVLGLVAGFLVFWLTREDEEKKADQVSERIEAPPVRPLASGTVKIGTIWREESGRVLVQTPGGALLEGEAAQKLFQQAWIQPDQPTLSNQPVAPEMPPPVQPQPEVPARQSLEGIAQPSTSKPLEPVSVNAVDALSRAFQKSRPPAPRSLAAQINDILQEHIAGTDLARRGLRLVDMPDHELGVELDLHTYHGIDEVPDPAVTQAIRDAAKEWQSKNR